jgi:hypothetical protein
MGKRARPAGREAVEVESVESVESAADVVRGAIRADGPSEPGDRDAARRVIARGASPGVLDGSGRRDPLSRRVNESGNVREHYRPSTCSTCGRTVTGSTCSTCGRDAVPSTYVVPDGPVRIIREQSLPDALAAAVTMRSHSTVHHRRRDS